MFKTKKVSTNNIKVLESKKETKPIKGQDWFPTKFPNLFILAKKNSGKTTVISNVLEHCAGKQTKFIFIVSTIEKDPTWIKIVKKFEKKHEVLSTVDIMDDGVNIVQQFLDDQKPEEDEDNAPPPPPPPITTKPRIKMVGSGGQIAQPPQTQEKEPNIEEKKPNKKIITPDYIIVLDDLGDSMRNKALTQLLKTNRHHNTMVILSSQSVTDLLPSAINQLDYILLFGKIPIEKLEDLYDILKLSISFEEFYNLYQDATKEPYQFFYINRALKEDEFRKGFTDKYILD